MDIKKPNLFVVGAPKCGTTSLHYYLNQNSNIYMSDLKEISYFCKDLVKESDKFHKAEKFFLIRDEKSYLNLFKKGQNKKVIGESSTWNLYSKIAAKEIYKFNPKAKIIIMIREPISMMYSLHSQLYPINENTKKFEEAIGKIKDRKNNNNKIPKYTIFPSILYYYDIVNYEPQIKRYYEIFPKKQVKVIIFDDLKDNPKKVYFDVLKFLKINNKETPNFDIKNQSHITRFSFVEKMLIFVGNNKLKKIILKFISLNKLRKILNTIYNLNSKSKKREKLNQELKIKLMKKNKQNVKKISKLINRNLINLWKYDKI